MFGSGIGHGPEAISHPSFRGLFARGCEWAATGEVTLGPPERSGAARWRVWPHYDGDPCRFDRSGRR